MPRIREYRLNKNMHQTELLSKIKEKDARVDIGLLSKYENGIALPTPTQMEAINHVLDTIIKDLYYPQEIVYKHTKSTKENNVYKLTVRLTPQMRSKVNSEVLKVCGYKSITDYIIYSLNKLDETYKKIKEKRIVEQNPYENDDDELAWWHK